MADRQPEAGPFSVVFRGVERIEDPWNLPLRDPAPLIVDLETHLLRAAVRLDAYGTRSAAHRLLRVLKEVSDQLMDQRRIHLHPRQVGIAVTFEGDRMFGRVV